VLRHTINQLFTSAQHLLLLIIGLHASTYHSVIFRSFICCKCAQLPETCNTLRTWRWLIDQSKHAVRVLVVINVLLTWITDCIIICVCISKHRTWNVVCPRESDLLLNTLCRTLLKTDWAWRTDEAYCVSGLGYFLGAFRNFCEKRLLASSCLSVCLSVCSMQQFGSQWTDFHEIFIFEYFSKYLCRKFKFSLKSDKNNRYFTWRPLYIIDRNTLGFSQPIFCGW